MLSPLSSDVIVPRTQERLAWRPLGVRVSAVPDVCYPWDPAVLSAIHEFDPQVIPVMVLRAYRAQTGGVRIFRYHAIASFVWNSDHYPAPWTHQVMTSTHGDSVRPTHMDLHLEDRSSRRGDGLPGKYLPFDWRLYQVLRSQYQRWTVSEVLQAIQRPYEEKQRQVDKAGERTAHIVRRNESWLKQRMDNILAADPQKLYATLAERAAIKKTMVDLNPPEPYRRLN